VEDRTGAIVELLSGKATVDQLAFRFGVYPKTVDKWREVALEGIEQSMRQGSRAGRSGSWIWSAN
jgi:transposase-like protein